jgi:hypothetical protein
VGRKMGGKERKLHATTYISFFEILAIPLLLAGLPSETAKHITIGFIFLLLISMQSLIERLYEG